MDAIFGIWRFDGQGDTAATLKKMASALAPRSERPTARLLHVDGNLGMGRLSIGRSVEDTPLTQDGARTCIADARFYAVPDTASPLTLTAPEREAILLERHARLGDAAPDGIEGDFTYAIYDQDKCRLTLGRDAIGVRPLFYANKPGAFFAWGTHSDMLISSGVIEDDFDVDRALGEFMLSRSGDTDTNIRGLLRLAPAHVMSVTPAGLAQKRYWSLKIKNRIKDPARFKECAEELRRLIDAATQKRLAPSDSIGAHLSGGIDSTAVSVLAARALRKEGKPLHSYSFVAETRPDVQFVDERPFVDATVQGEPNIYNTKIAPPFDREIDVTRIRDRLGGHHDAEEKVLTSAVRDNVDVILSGWGGDEVSSFNGRGAYAEHFVRGRWRHLWREINARSKLYKMTKTKILATEVASFVLPTPIFRGIVRLAGKQGTVMANERRAAFLKPDARTNRSNGITMKASADHNRLALFNNGHIAYRCENWALQGAPHGISYAFPLLDRDVLEYAIRLPASFFLKEGVRRAVYREAMKDVLPESVRTRLPKFAPFPCMLLRTVEERQTYLSDLEELAKDPELAALIDVDAVREALEDLPTAQEVKDAFEEEVRGGRSPDLGGVMAAAPVELMKALRRRQEMKQG